MGERLFQRATQPSCSPFMRSMLFDPEVLGRGGDRGGVDCTWGSHSIKLWLAAGQPLIIIPKFPFSMTSFHSFSGFWW